MALTTSAQTLITGVFRLLGITAQGENPTSDELMDGAARLREVIDGWAIERLTQRWVARREYPTVAGQSAYLIAPQGTFPTPDWIGPTPAFVESVALLLTDTSPYTETPLGEMTPRGYAGVSQKTLPNSQPTTWFYQAGTFHLWPVPDNDRYPVVLYVPEALAQFVDLQTEYLLPSGYVRALRFTLARELAHEFGRELPPGLEMLALEANAALRAANVPMLDLRVPFVRGGSYDIFSDTYRGGGS